VNTPDWRDVRIAELESLLAKAMDTIDRLSKEVEALKARLNRNSSNSSKPPSSDPPWLKKDGGSKGGKRGGQDGHDKKVRALVPEDEVTYLTQLTPCSCGKCGGKLVEPGLPPKRHQVVDLPPIEPIVNEYQLFSGWCAACQHLTRAELPAEVPRGGFGPGVIATTVLLTGKYRLSKRSVVEVLRDLFNIQICLGSVSKLESMMSDALAEPMREAEDYVRAQPAVNCDETGWREDKKKAWLWTAVTALVTVYRIASTRGSEVVKEMLGSETQALVGSDRFGAYTWLGVWLRQLCWAHLCRDFKRIEESGGNTGQIGKELLRLTRLFFKWWHKARDGTMTREEFQDRMIPIKLQVSALLWELKLEGKEQMRGLATRLLNLEPAMWTFVRNKGIEPTNNAAERALRHAVIWRKSSFGTDSKTGSRFVERILTASATLRQQNRNLLAYLTEACDASLKGEPSPSLLPQLG